MNFFFKKDVSNIFSKGLGRTHPDPNEAFKLEDDVELPMGKGVDSGLSYTSLLYNEYFFIN